MLLPTQATNGTICAEATVPISGSFLEFYGFEERRMLERVMKRHAPPITNAVEFVVAPAAIERALQVYEQLRPHDPSVILQARKILTQRIYGIVGVSKTSNR